MTEGRNEAITIVKTYDMPCTKAIQKGYFSFGPIITSTYKSMCALKTAVRSALLIFLVRLKLMNPLQNSIRSIFYLIILLII